MLPALEQWPARRLSLLRSALTEHSTWSRPVLLGALMLMPLNLKEKPLAAIRPSPMSCGKDEHLVGGARSATTQFRFYEAVAAAACCPPPPRPAPPGLTLPSPHRRVKAVAYEPVQLVKREIALDNQAARSASSPVLEDQELQQGRTHTGCL